MLRMPVAKFGAKFLWGRRRGGDKISMGEAGGLQTMIFVNAGCAPQSGAGLRPTTAATIGNILQFKISTT